VSPSPATWSTILVQLSKTRAGNSWFKAWKERQLGRHKSMMRQPLAQYDGAVFRVQWARLPPPRLVQIYNVFGRRRRRQQMIELSEAIRVICLHAYRAFLLFDGSRHIPRVDPQALGRRLPPASRNVAWIAMIVRPFHGRTCA